MGYTVLQLVKVYKGNAKLLNEMAKAHKDNYKTITCYMSGKPDGLNQMENIVDETIYLDLSPSKVKWTRYATLKALAKLIDEKQVDLVVCQFRTSYPNWHIIGKNINWKTSRSWHITRDCGWKSRLGAENYQLDFV